MKKYFFNTLLLTFIFILFTKDFAYGATRKDFNKDGLVDILDIAAMAKNHNAVEGSTYWNPSFDLNSDKIIDLFDIVTLSKSYGLSYANSIHSGNVGGNINNGGEYGFRNGWLYTNTMDTILIKTNLQGTVKEWLFGNQYARSINVTDSYVFYISGLDGNIYRTNLDGNDTICLNKNHQVRSFTVYRDYIYYINFNDNDRVYKMNLQGGEITALTQDYGCKELNVTEDSIYYINENFKICRADKDGKNRNIISQDNCSEFLVDGDSIYYTNAFMNHSLYKMNVDGTDVIKLNDDDTRNININDDVLYYSNNDDSGKMYAIRSDGRLRTKLTDESAIKIHIVEDYVYYKTGNEGTSTRRINKATLTEEVSSDQTMGNLPENIYLKALVASNGKYYYELDEGNSEIYRYNMDGTGKTLIHSDIKIYCINLVGDWIYYTGTNPHNNYTYGIYKVRADGSGGRIEVSRDATEFMVVEGDWIYYIPCSEYSERDPMKKVRVDGTGTTTIDKKDFEVGYYFTIAGEYIYLVNNNHEIVKMKKDGSDKSKIASNVRYMSVLGSKIYFSSTTDEKIRYIPITGGPDTIVINEDVNSFAIYNNKLYYTSDHKIYSSNLDGTAKSYLVTLELGRTYNLAGGYLFYTSTESVYGSIIVNRLKLN